ncbi:MAG: methyl-accepting chemotaxis protein [Lachnospiraceae bacterium]|nr:methyl-accepting chemotaxis protein [Lachnospiraceae bacterium]
MIKKIKNAKITTKVVSLIGLSVLFMIIFAVLLFMVIGNAVEWFGGDKASNYIRSFTVFSFLVMVLGLISIVGLGVYVSRSIRMSLKQIVKAIKIVGEGGVDVELKKFCNDEFGEIVDALLETVGHIKDDAEVAYQIAEGDLSMTITPRSDIDVLGNAFNKLVTDQNHILGNIKEASMQVTTGSEQVASASQSLAQGSTMQASSLEEITASISEIADRTKVNASQANNANDLVREAKEGAVRGNAQMGEMIDAMNDINNSSENISKIIKVIDDIAFQTNILALNAAVEAARAGAHGKGFAVVAEEVRNLAGKSAQAASETAELIEDSISKIAKGSKLAENTAKALDTIVGNIDKIVELISNIALASNEQATAITQIDQAIGQVSDVVQSNSATSEQCAAASEELSNQAHRLRELIANFKLQSYNQPYYREDSFMKEEKIDNESIISLGSGFGKY